MKINFLLLLTFSIIYTNAQIQLKYEHNETLEYHEIIKAYKSLDKKHDNTRLIEAGWTDSGLPLHLFIISEEKQFSASENQNNDKRIIFINNAIHPGEPCGTDASIQFVMDLLSEKSTYRKYLSNTVICIIPAFNIGGMLNRGSYSRANQNGPAAYGFRGNSRNYDLNRDFGKADTKNARSLMALIQEWQPNIFIDTHTSNGSDYQYVMTLIATNPQQLPKELGQFHKNKMLPFLYNDMAEKGYEMSPYVISKNKTPDTGIIGFTESPRYASGYMKQFNIIAFVTEAHMFKPYRDRVLATRNFLNSSLEFVSKNSKELARLKKVANEEVAAQKEFVLRWKRDTTKFDLISFKGYTAKYKPSNFTGHQRYYFDRNEPFEKEIKYFNYFKPERSITTPQMYIVPQQWQNVIDVLKLNKVKMKRISKDTVLSINCDYITELNTARLYEGHYPHFNFKTEKKMNKVNLYKGDYVIYPNQVRNNYIVEMLEIEAVDAFFVWNYFDPILNRKEYFSPYVFEDKAEEILNQNIDLKKEFLSKQEKDSTFANNSYTQLNFVYENSNYYEKTHNCYPVYRIESEVDLPVD